MSARTPRHAAAQHRPRRLLRGAGLAALSVALFAGSSFGLAYNDFQTNIDRYDIDDYLGERPTEEGVEQLPIDASAGEDINIVILGSDTREGEGNEEFAEPDGGGQRSDTTMIAHISADRTRVEIVSIPRDTLVTVPECMMADGTWTSPQDDAMFNSAFSIGSDGGNLGTAAACTIRTIEELSGGVLIDDFVIVDFAGFINVVDALGGVPMCIPEPINDPLAGLELEPGTQVLDGRTALGFARARYIGDGSDISRIGRQQELVAAIAREALSTNLLTDLPKLYRFLDSATQTLTTGSQLGSIPTLAGLAYSLRGLDLENIVFETMPFEWAGPRVRPAPEAEEVWAALRADEPIQGALNAAGEEPTDEPTDGATEMPTTEEPPVTAQPEATETPICP